MGGKEKMKAQGVQVCEGWEGRRRWRHRGCRCVRGGREGEDGREAQRMEVCEGREEECYKVYTRVKR